MAFPTLTKRKLLLCLITLAFITSIIWSFVPASMENSRPKTNFNVSNKDVCASSAAKSCGQRTAVIVVLSARSNYVNRNLIRQTYGSVRVANNVRILAVVFLLGNLDEKGVGEVQHLDVEMEQFGDIVMGDFVDSYRNLSLKTIMGYDWLTSHCRQAQFVIKTDDDVAVNIFQLTKEIDSWSPAALTSSNIWCAVHTNENTITDVGSRYYASRTDFPTGRFPSHCAGVGYITTIGVIDRIVDEISRSFSGTVCTHEDVFITSIVPARINSIQSSFRTKPMPIGIVNKYHEWFMILRSFPSETGNKSKAEKLNEFRIRYDRKMFFLFPHNREFSYRYLQFWEIIKESFSE